MEKEKSTLESFQIQIISDSTVVLLHNSDKNSVNNELGPLIHFHAKQTDDTH